MSDHLTWQTRRVCNLAMGAALVDITCWIALFWWLTQ